MKRNLFTLAAGLSLLLFVVTAALWVRSYYVSDWAKWMPDDWNSPAWRTVTIRTIRGGLQIEDYRVSWVGDHDCLKQIPGWYWGCGEPPIRAVRWTPGYSRPSYDPSIHFAYDWPDIAAEPRLIPRVERYGQQQADSTYSDTWRGLIVPFWIPAAVTCVLPVWSGIRTVRRCGRVVRGLCLRCGYDVRATPARCPECGAPNRAPATLP